MKAIDIFLNDDVYEEIEAYAEASNVKTSEFIVGLVHDFLSFQSTEMTEVYLNDDGVSWLEI